MADGTRFGGALPDRAAWAFANIMRGSPDASIRALLAPDTLSPKEHQSLVDKWFGPEDSLGKSVASFATNPLTLVGLALTLRYPIPTMTELASLASRFAPTNKMLPAIMRPFMGLQERFLGTGVDDVASWVMRRARKFSEAYLQPHAVALEELTGATGKTPSVLEQIHLGLKQDELSGGLQKALRTVNGEANRLNKAIKDGTIVNPFTNKELIPILDEADWKVADLNPVMERFRSRVTEQTIAPQYGEIKAAAETGVLKRTQKKLKKLDSAVKEMGIDAGVQMGPDKLPEQIPNILPHIAIRTEAELEAEAAKKVASLLHGPEIQKLAGQADKFVSGSIVERLDRMIPSVDQVREAAKAGLINPKLAQQIEMVANANKAWVDTKMAAALSSGGRDVATAASGAAKNRLLQYDLRFNQVVTQYTDKMSRTHALQFAKPEAGIGLPDLPEGAGKWLEKKTLELSAMGGQQRRMAHDLATSMLPALTGRMTTNQYMKALEWSGLREASAKLVQNPYVKGVLGKKLAGRLESMINAGDPAFTWAGAGSRISQYLFTTTIGFNPISAAVNAMQPMLTTGAMVQPGFLAKGYERAWGGMIQARKLMKQGYSEMEAMKKVFPQFIESGMEDAPVFRELLTGTFEAPGAALTTMAEASGKGAGAAWRKVQGASLAMFREVERLNFLTSFEAARLQGLSEGLLPATAIETAAKVTRLSQAWSGPLSTPIGLQNLWAPLRQFVSFPMKYANFLTMAGGRHGGAFTPGTIGRTLLAGTGLYEAGRASGTDLSRGLVFGSFPGPEASGPFAPLPVVPPLVSMVGAVGLDLAKGSLENVPRMLPLLVPGGIQARRSVTALAPGIARNVGRPWVDYENRNPDGSYPVYDKDGKLQHNAKPMELLQSVLGIRPGSFQDEDERTRYILSQSEQIKMYRAQYMDRMLRNDPTGAQEVNLEYQERYGLGPVQVAQEDWDKLKKRREMTRLERVLQGVPANARPLFNSLVSTAMIQEGPGGL